MSASEGPGGGGAYRGEARSSLCGDAGGQESASGELRSFAPTGWFELRGRGWVATVAGIPGFNPRPLVGQQVEIGGKPYVVKGVETYATMNATGQNFGLLVGER